MTISESLLAMTIFRSEFDARFAIVFAGLILVKGFHWIIRDRVDYVL
jgi:E3 ubiquitin-protein ligase synoviolin